MISRIPKFELNLWCEIQDGTCHAISIKFTMVYEKIALLWLYFTLEITESHVSSKNNEIYR